MVTVDKVYLRKRDTFSEGFTTMKSMDGSWIIFIMMKKSTWFI